jgi:hypothetical protein
MLENLDWMEEAACRRLWQSQKDKWLYPEVHTPETRKKAAEICGACPVQQTCLDYAIKNRIGSELGCHTFIYGGLDFKGRSRYLAEQIKAKVKR